MAQVKLAELRVSALRRADMENSSFVGRHEANDYVNDAASEFHDEFLVKTYRDHFRKKLSFDTIASTESYKLPADFLQVQQVFYLQGGIRYRLEMFMADELTDYEADRTLPVASGEYMRYRVWGEDFLFTPRNNSGGTIEIWYTPQHRRLIDPFLNDGVTPNPEFHPGADVLDIRVVPGWQEYIEIGAAMDMVSKEESDTSHLERKLAGLKRRIVAVAMQRDSGKPQRIRDAYASRSRYPYRRRLY